MKRVIIFTILLIASNITFGQTPEEQVEELKKENQALKDSISNSIKLIDAVNNLNNRLLRDFDGDKKERVQLGLSFAYGELSKEDKSRYKLPSISPMDSTLQFQQLDGRFILVSTTMTITPFLYADWITKAKSNTPNIKKGKLWAKTGLWLLENSGFSVNINFLEIAAGSSQQSFNQVVEGGIGYSLRLNKNIYWSFSREIKFLNSLNDSFKGGEPIYLDGNKIGSIDELSTDDQDYYHTKTLLHWSSRIIVSF